MSAKSGGVLGLGAWITGIVLALILFGTTFNRADEPDLTPAQQAAEAARQEAKREAETRRELAAIERSEKRDAALTWVVIVIAGTVGLAMIGGLVVAIVYAVRRSGWHRPNDLGLLPVSLKDQAAGSRALDAFHVARIADASRTLPPHTLHFAPRTDHRSLERLEPPGELSPVETGVAPTYLDLLKAGEIGPHSPGLVYYGWTPEGPIRGSWDLLYSASVVGWQGSGKTIGGAGLIAQSLPAVKVYVTDPKINDPQGLLTRLGPLHPWLADMAQTDDEIVAQAAEVEAILNRRMNGDPDRSPVLWFVDEWTVLMLRETVRPHLERVGLQVVMAGRTNCVNLVAAGQRWTKEAGGKVRPYFTSCFMFRSPPENVRYATGLRSSLLPEDTHALAPGEFYLLDTDGQVRRAQVPLMSKDAREEMQATAELLQVRGFPGAGKHLFPTVSERVSRRPLSLVSGNGVETPSGAPGNGFGNPVGVSPEERDAIIKLYLSGQSPYAITKAMNQGKRLTGRPQQELAALVNDVIREALRSGYRPEPTGQADADAEEVMAEDDDLDPQR